MPSPFRKSVAPRSGTAVPHGRRPPTLRRTPGGCERPISGAAAWTGSLPRAGQALARSRRPALACPGGAPRPSQAASSGDHAGRLAVLAISANGRCFGRVASCWWGETRGFDGRAVAEPGAASAAREAADGAAAERAASAHPGRHLVGPAPRRAGARPGATLRPGRDGPHRRLSPARGRGDAYTAPPTPRCQPRPRGWTPPRSAPWRQP
jgi:hypothetical protein